MIAGCPSNEKQFGTIVSLELGRPELFLDMGTALGFPKPTVS